MLERRPVAATAWSERGVQPAVLAQPAGSASRYVFLQRSSLPCSNTLAGSAVLLGQLLEHFLVGGGPVLPRFRTGRLSFL